MKVCLLIPVRNSTKFLTRLFFYLSQLKPKPDMIYFIENNSYDGTLKKVVTECKTRKLPFRILRFWTKDNAVEDCDTIYDVIAIARELGLKAARNGNFDYAIFLDSDVYPIDHDLITKLTSYEEDVVGGTYERVLPYPFNVCVASLWDTPVGLRPKIIQNVGYPYDLPTVTSGGCLCLSKKVIQDRRLRFFPVNDRYNTVEGSSEDFGFCFKAIALSYNIVLDNTAKLEHRYVESSYVKKPWHIGFS